MIDLPDAAVPIVVVVSDSPAAATSVALRALLAHSAPLAAPAVVAGTGRLGSADDKDFGHLVAHQLEADAWADRVLVVAPPRRSVVRRSRGDWIAVDVGVRAQRLTTVALPTALATAGSIVVANDLRLESVRRPVFAIGLWARYADWRVRLGARLSDEREGLTAEIAAAVAPRLLLLADRWQSLSLLAATTDQIAAELTGRTLRPTTGAGDDEPLGPWEAPLVQRATELDLGVRSPSQVAIRAHLLVREGSQLPTTFARWVDAFAGRLGVKDVSIEL
jgi:hypothetical protein